MGSSKKTTVSYWYHPFFQLVLHEGPFDKLLEIRGGDVPVWQGEMTASGSIEIAAGNAWGGEEKEGGIEGTVDISFGEMDAQPNEFFQTAMGHDPSGHNGYALLQFNSGRYGAGNPYPKPISVLTERIYEGWLDGVCWYPEKAGIFGSDGGGVPGSLFVTGQPKLEGGPRCAVGTTGMAPLFTGVPQSTGANVSGLPCRHGNTTVIVANGQARYSTSPTEHWVASDTAPTSHPNGVVGHDAGWLAYNQISSLTGNGFWQAAGMPDEWANYYPDSGVWHISFAAGYYWFSAPRALRRAAAPGGPWSVVASGGEIYDWVDIVEHKGELYATCYASESSGSSWWVRRSSDGGATWADIVLTVPGSGHRPYFLCPVGEHLVVWCLGGGLWTDANDWSAWIDTGIGGAGIAGMMQGLVNGGRQIAAADGLVYVIAPSDKLAVFNPDTLEVSPPVTMPVSGAIGIVATPSLPPPPGEARYMNPAHVIYDSLTYLQGEPIGTIDQASFLAAADRLYAEGFGICTRYNHATETIEQFRQRILDLIGAECSRYNGKWYLDLIRELSPEEIAELPVLTDDDILEWQEDPTNRDDAVNQVAVKWFDPETKQSRLTAHVHALAAINTLGTVNPEVRDYPEVPYEALANRLALRDLRNKSVPTRRFNLTTNRKPYNWRKARAFRLQAPKRGIADMVCRVGEIDRGTLQSGAIRLVAVQDTFAMPATAYVVGQPPVPPPSQVPEPIVHQLLFEAPYVELAGVLSAGDLAALDDDAGYIVAAGVRPGNGQGYALLTRPAGGEFDRIGVFDWCPSAVVVEAAGYTDTEFTLASGSLLARVELGTAALWGSEIVRVDALDPVTGEVTLGRGCADTVAAKHAAGERIYFFDTWSASDRVEYVAAETVEVKLLPRTGTQELAPDDAPTLDVTLDQRAARPYPPAKMRAGGQSDPTVLVGDVVVTWAHRDRHAQADQLVDAEIDSVGPEVGTTYTLRAYLNDVLDDEQIGIAGTTATWTPGGAGQARIELFAVRDALESWQAQVREFAVGAPLLAEDGSPITAEDGSPIIME